MKTPSQLLITGAACLAGGFLLGRTTSTDTPAAGNSHGRTIATLHQTQNGAGRLDPKAQDQSRNETDPTQSLAGLSSEEITSRTLQALREPDYVKRWAAFGLIAAGMNAQNSRAVIEGVEKRYREGGNTRREGELIQFCEGRIFGEAAIALPLEPNGRPSYAVQHKMRGWASADPLTSIKWLGALPEGVARNTLMDKWRDGIKDAEPDAIAAVFDQLEPAMQASMAPKLLDSVFAKEGLDGLASWYTNASTKGMTTEVIQSAWSDIVSRMSQDPRNWDKATEFILAQSGTVDLKSVNFDDYTRRVALGAPGKAFDLFSQLAENSPDIQERLPRLIQQTIDTSSGQTLNLVGEWLQANREHQSYDRVAYEFARRTVQDDPEAAKQWAGTIRDESLRNQLSTSFGEVQVQ